MAGRGLGRGLALACQRSARRPIIATKLYQRKLCTDRPAVGQPEIEEQEKGVVTRLVGLSLLGCVGLYIYDVIRKNTQQDEVAGMC